MPDKPVQLNIAGIVEDSIVDGPGMRLTIFTQGCPHHCPGCHNQDTWEIKPKHIVNIDAIARVYKSNPLLAGITFSGGEPLLQAKALIPLAEEVIRTGGNVWCYTGFTYEKLLEKNDPYINRFLELTDVLVDGPFILAKRNLELEFRGSSNQRLLDKQLRDNMRESTERCQMIQHGLSM